MLDRRAVSQDKGEVGWQVGVDLLNGWVRMKVGGAVALPGRGRDNVGEGSQPSYGLQEQGQGRR